MLICAIYLFALLICCRCFGLDVVPQILDVRFVAVAVDSKWYPNAKMYDLSTLLWSRSGAPMLRCTICCRCFWFGSGAPMVICTICCCFALEVVPKCQYVRFVAVALAWKWCPKAMMCDLLPLLWPGPILRCTICCGCFGLGMVPQCQDVRNVAVALVFKWRPNAMMYELLLLLWPRHNANAKMYDVLPLLWPRSVAAMLRWKIFAIALASKWWKICLRCCGLQVSGAAILTWMICCRCFGLKVVPQC